MRLDQLFSDFASPAPTKSGQWNYQAPNKSPNCDKMSDLEKSRSGVCAEMP